MIVVTPPDPFVDKTRALAFLNKKLALSVPQDELFDQIIAASCAAIVERVGYVSPAGIEERVRFYDSGKGVLTARPVISVETPDIILLNPEGIVSGGTDVMDIQYTAGRTVTPENYEHAAFEMVLHLWNSTQNNQNQPLTGTSDQAIIPQTNWLLPIRVRELLGLGRNFRDMPFVAIEEEA